MPVRSLVTAVLIALAYSAHVAAQDASDEAPPSPPAANTPGEATESIGLLIEPAAAANGLPIEFFARVIWRESHYNPNAVGPPTRSGEGAPGLGQVMPGTAADLRLLDPLDPFEARA